MKGWLGRDSDGRVHLYETEPVKNPKYNEWYSGDRFCPRIKEEDIPLGVILNWSDEKPVYVNTEEVKPVIYEWSII